MACWLLLQQPAGAAAALWPCSFLPASRRSSATRKQPHRVPCAHQSHQKIPMNVLQPYRCRTLVVCTSSGSSAEVAGLSRSAAVSNAHSYISIGRCVNSVPGTFTVLSGYWIGPDADDGCGSVEAMLQRLI